MDYDHQNHSKFLLMYHMIFVCKYRKKLLIQYGEEIKQIFCDIAEKSDFTILEMEVDQDHIHLLVKSVPKISTLQIAKRLKQISTNRIWEAHETELQNKEHVIFDGPNDLSNCVPSCQSCNSHKWKYSLEQWYNENNPEFSEERLNKILKWLAEDYIKFVQE